MSEQAPTAPSKRTTHASASESCGPILKNAAPEARHWAQRHIARSGNDQVNQVLDVIAAVFNADWRRPSQRDDQFLTPDRHHAPIRAEPIGVVTEAGRSCVLQSCGSKFNARRSVSPVSVRVRGTVGRTTSNEYQGCRRPPSNVSELLHVWKWQIVLFPATVAAPRSHEQLWVSPRKRPQQAQTTKQACLRCFPSHAGCRKQLLLSGAVLRARQADRPPIMALRYMYLTSPSPERSRANLRRLRLGPKSHSSPNL